MVDRKIICKIRTGSYLYGTQRPDSDQDFAGVFLPSDQDLFGLQSAPSEFSQNSKKTAEARNSKDDIDCKFFSLQKFLKLTAEGQPGQLELLFAPLIMYEEVDGTKIQPEWQEVLSNRNIFLSKNSIRPFIGFAIAQAHKATIKGKNLNEIRALVEWAESLSSVSRNYPLSYFLKKDGKGNCQIIDPDLPLPKGRQPVKLSPVANILFKIEENDSGFETFRVAGRQYDPNVKVCTFLSNLRLLQDKYGSRSVEAAKTGLDRKSLTHAYRLLGQAKELLTEGIISLPRPPDEVAFLRQVRDGLVDKDWQEDITSKLDELRVLEQNSSLPQTANYQKINKLCIELTKKHLYTLTNTKTRIYDNRIKS